jgi:8-oxo-dGTP pyrophosphatase MutT (NUDIX family)
MFKVFFEERQLILQSAGDRLPNVDLVLNLDGNEEPTVLKSIVDAFNANTRAIGLCLRSSNLDKTWETFCSLFTEITAAGGVVFNDDGQLLMIYRNDKWDLPKGKLEIGEDPATAAVREVEEECGIDQLTITKQLPTVYHTYTQKGKNYLKETIWYEMKSGYKGKLTPQTEEGITRVQWMSRKDIILAMENTWSSLHTLLREELVNAGNELK